MVDFSKLFISFWTMVIRTFTLTLRNPQIYFDRRLFLYYITAIFKLSKRYYTYTLLTDPANHWYCEGSLSKLRFHIYIHPGSCRSAFRSNVQHRRRRPCSPRHPFTTRRVPFSLSGVRRGRRGARRPGR